MKATAAIAAAGIVTETNVLQTTRAHMEGQVNTRSAEHQKEVTKGERG